MSPRINIIRKVLNPPKIKGLKPYGTNVTNENTENIELLYEEYEALRLCDYDMFTHFQASQVMNVSRPTFTRIYARARQKIAKALVEGKQISIEGGKVYFDSDWYKCNNCNCFFNNVEKNNTISNCPLCKSSDIQQADNYTETKDLKQCTDICFCPNCGKEMQHQIGTPCNQVLCVDCNINMKRKNLKKCNN